MKSYRTKTKRLLARCDELEHQLEVGVARLREELLAEVEFQKHHREKNRELADAAIRQRDEARVERDELRGALEMIQQITSDVSLRGEQTAAERRIAQIAHESLGSRTQNTEN